VTSDNEDEDELIGSSRFIEDDIIPLEKIVSINDLKKKSIVLTYY